MPFCYPEWRPWPVFWRLEHPGWHHHFSNTSYTDLFWTPHGGGNNFGVVTRNDVMVIRLPGEKVWGGHRISEQSELPAMIQEAYNLGTTGVEENPGVKQVINVASVRGYDIGVASLFFIEPVDNPPIMEGFLAIPAAMDTTGVQTLSSLSANMSDVGDIGEDAKDNIEKEVRLSSNSASR